MASTSACGLFECEGCEHSGLDRCPGCFDGNKRLKAIGADTCSIYNCVIDSGLESCADCVRPQCDIPRLIDGACPLRSAFQGKRWWAGRISDFFERRNRDQRVDDTVKKISPRTVERLRWYLLALQDMDDKGIQSVASREIARRVGVNAALVRKDLSYFGDFGTPSYGYSVRFLIQRIREILHLDEPCQVAWVGAQRLAENLDLLIELGSHNCKVVSLFDIDETRVGARVAGMRVQRLSQFTSVAEEFGINAAVIAVPAAEAQKVADTLLATGVKAFLNLTSTVLSVPASVVVRNANVVSEMMALSFYSANEGVKMEAE